MKWAVYSFALLAVTGCAQLPASLTAQNDRSAGASEVIRFDIPADALGARDPQLSALLAKAGSLAAAQKQPTIVQVTALGQDLPYLNHAIWKGVPAQRAARITLENLTAGANQPYSVSIKSMPSGS